ncbi:hypothetical protein NP493_292g02009 [Ridgeia piscesae]|uniref:Uncharacterized protein n=1 Tax=Ridgeia piscesae TaxID=27915 RepID=A0AAD9UBU1_RIDPI|nr:hypothetical protein NP493_292g02009 [Ridgeia piscesae]
MTSGSCVPSSVTPSTMTRKLLELAVLLRRFMISTSVVSGFIIGSMLVTVHLSPQPGTAWKSEALPTVSVLRTFLAYLTMALPIGCSLLASAVPAMAKKASAGSTRGTPQTWQCGTLVAHHE